MNGSEQPHTTDEIMQLVADLYTAQHAVNGRVDLFELKKAVMRRVYQIELRDDLALNMLPKGLNRALDTIVEKSLFKLHLDNFLAQNPDKSLKPIRPLRFALLLLKYLLICKLSR
jgi:hypothetical protein